MRKPRRDAWNTYKEVPYFPVTQDQKSAGWMVHRQVRKIDGKWYCRDVQVNCNHRSAGEKYEITRESGEGLYDRACELP